MRIWPWRSGIYPKTLWGFKISFQKRLKSSSWTSTRNLRLYLFSRALLGLLTLRERSRLSVISSSKANLTTEIRHPIEQGLQVWRSKGSEAMIIRNQMGSRSSVNSQAKERYHALAGQNWISARSCHPKIISQMTPTSLCFQNTRSVKAQTHRSSVNHKHPCIQAQERRWAMRERWSLRIREMEVGHGWERVNVNPKNAKTLKATGPNGC